MGIQEKVLVTGSDGMLGSSICRELLKRGYLVKAMTLPNSSLDVLSDIHVERVDGNVLDTNSLEKAMEDCQYVIHAAALTHVWPRRSEIVTRVNYIGTKNVANAAQKRGLKRMIHIGTASSFGYGSKEVPGDESQPYAFGKLGLDYIESKYHAQSMLLEKYTQENFPIIIINPTYMIGPFDSGPSSGKMIIELLKDNIPGYSTGGKNFVCSVDVASGAVNALKMGTLGECYIAGGENLEYHEFFKKICVLKNKKFKLIKVPYSAVLTLGFINSSVARIIRRPPNLSFTMTRMAGVSQYYSSQKAQKEIDLPQTPIEVGITQCINWFETKGYLK